MRREIDESWIEEAVEQYGRIDALRAQFDRALATVEVSACSPDGLVEVVVTADGTIRDVRFTAPLHHHATADVARSVRDAVTAAAEAAATTRGQLHAETFAAYRPLRSNPRSF